MKKVEISISEHGNNAAFCSNEVASFLVTLLSPTIPTPTNTWKHEN
jgi:hypothetical protein